MFSDGQGQTIPHVLVDIALPQQQNIVVQSVCRFFEELWARNNKLKVVDDKVFLESHEPELVSEDKRLGDLDEPTRVWRQKICFHSNSRYLCTYCCTRARFVLTQSALL